jgi:hypothetical protein
MGIVRIRAATGMPIPRPRPRPRPSSKLEEEGCVSVEAVEELSVWEAVGRSVPVPEAGEGIIWP